MSRPARCAAGWPPVRQGSPLDLWVKRETEASLGNGGSKVPDAQLRQQCQQAYEDLRDQVLQLLISARWIEGEAREVRISVTGSEIRQGEQSFGTGAGYERFLEQSGQTEADILLRARLDLLSKGSGRRWPTASRRSPTSRSPTTTRRTRRGSRRTNGVSCGSR
jgi:hypothetical protein